mgnify:FL=1
MKKSLHFFGDSFTEGHFLKKTNQVWPKLIHTAFPNFNYSNLGSGGASNIFILKQVITNLSQINKGDIVTIFETSPIRTEIYSSQYKKSLKDKKYLDIFDTKEKALSLFNFTYDHRYDYYEEFGEFYTELFLDIGKYIEAKGASFFLYTNKKFEKQKDKYENYTTLSNGKVVDEHWTPKGNYDFAKYFLSKYIHKKFPQAKLSDNIDMSNFGKMHILI